MVGADFGRKLELEADSAQPAHQMVPTGGRNQVKLLRRIRQIAARGDAVADDYVAEEFAVHVHEGQAAAGCGVGDAAGGRFVLPDLALHLGGIAKVRLDVSAIPGGGLDKIHAILSAVASNVEGVGFVVTAGD